MTQFGYLEQLDIRIAITRGNISKIVSLYPRHENGYNGQTLNFLLNFREIVKNIAIKKSIYQDLLK